MEKKKTVAGLLAVGLLTSMPWTSGLAEGSKWINVNVYEEQEGSKINS
jgi:hypothetical protein